MKFRLRLARRAALLALLASAGLGLDVAASGTDPGAPSAGDTIILGPFTGVGARLHPDNLAPYPIKYYGTDLGFSYLHDGQIHFLFGDTLAVESGEWVEGSELSGGKHDDMFGSIALADWPDPTLITSLNMPPIKLRQEPGTNLIAGINPGHVMDGLKTPEAGFSSGDREFAVLLLTKPQACVRDADCDAGLSCDTGLGFAGAPPFQEAELTLGCFEGRPGCVAETLLDAAGNPVTGSGMCVDRTVSVWSDTPAGRVAAVAMKQRIGLRSQLNPKEYTGIADWMTIKFLNTTVREVRAFNPERGAEPGQLDYHPPQDTDTSRRVLLWGRPGFVGVNKNHRTMDLYFAWADLPREPDFKWELHYYSGINRAGVPQFSLAENDAKPLDLDSNVDGVQPSEVHDIVQHMSVAWIEQLNKWVMFYGGGIDRTPVPAAGLVRCGILEVFVPMDCEEVDAGNGSIYLRTADSPWGPWTSPQEIIAGGIPEIPGSGQYGVGGALYQRACTQPGCAPHSAIPVFYDQGYGWFYGANIIEEWTRPAGNGVDILWNASTWDPYRVVLLRTRINP
jgi:hypothetical protein